MEHNDFYYILMSSLKHPYREHMTKESTSLLMKELDQAASCVVHHHGLGHHHHHQHQSSFDSSNNASTSSVFANNHRHHFNNHHQRRWDGLTFGSPKSPDNVARTILRALGASGDDRHRRPTPSTNQNANVQIASNANNHHYHKSIDNRRRSTSSGSISQSVQLTNGNHTRQQQQQQQQQAQTKIPNQNNSSSSLLSRCRRRLHLQLTKANGAEKAAANSPTRQQQGEQQPEQNQRKSRRSFLLNKRPSVVLATNGEHLHEEEESISASTDEGATPSSLPPTQQQFVTWPVRSLAAATISVDSPTILEPNSRKLESIGSGREEHQLIAYNSSLLMVKPNSTIQHQAGDVESESSSSSEASDSFAPPPPPPPPPPAEDSAEKETAILDSDDTPPSQQSIDNDRRRYFRRRDTDGGISIIEPSNVTLSSVEHHPPPTSYSQQHLSSIHHRGRSGSRENNRSHDAATPGGTTSTSGGGGAELEPSPDSCLRQQQNSDEGLATGVALSVDSTPATSGSSLQRIHNRLCTSYRLKVPVMKNPVDVCLLPNDDIAIADYDNGLLIVNDLGELVDHKKTYHEVNACGVACVRGGSCSPSFRIFLLVVRDGVWTINVYRNFDLVEMARCPTDAQIENWALRRLVVCVDSRLHLMASGETKSTIWTYEFDRGEWRVLLTENSGGRKATSGNYNDMSVKFDADTKETRIVLCEWKKAQLWTLFLNEKTDVMEEKSIKMKRVKGQEWIVQGPQLAVLDEQADILVYDGSGKLFLFDGDSYRCKKIVADLGRNEVSSLAVADGWIYALCRYRRCIEAFMYKENNETHI